MTVPFATLAKGIPYGYRPFYALEIDGIPYVFHELPGVDLNPSVHRNAPGTLIVDRGAKIGSVLTDGSAVAGALDFEFRLADPERSDIVKQLMKRPTQMTVLTEDVAYDATSLPVANTNGFENEPIYYGLSCSDFGGALLDEFVSIDPSPFGQPHEYKAGLLVANRPRRWKARRVRLWMLVLSPGGVVVQGSSDWKEFACCRFDGYIKKRPSRVGGIWSFVAEDSIRRLARPLPSGVSGKATWTLNDDQAILFDTDSAVTIEATHFDGSGSPATLTSYTLQPFTALPSTSRKSQQREALAAAWRSAVIADADYGAGSADLTYEHLNLTTAVDLTGVGRTHWPNVRVNLSGGGSINFNCIYQGRWDGWRRTPALSVPVSGAICRLPFNQAAEFFSASLSVLVDKGSPSDIPATGWVRLTSEGQTSYLRYTSSSIDPTNSGRVILNIDPADRPNLSALALAEGNPEATTEISVQFVWRDEGLVRDVLRRAITSTGFGVNGAYDTLARKQGYGLPNLAATSFSVFDGAFQYLPLQLAAEGSTSLETMVSGLLRLGGRALCTRRADDGSGVNITAVYVGSSDSGVPVATITDADLVATSGQKPVRVKRTFAAPQNITVTCRTIAAAGAEAGEAVLEYGDEHLDDWTEEAWSLDVYGVSRAALAAPGAAMALSQFRTGENRQIIEIDTRAGIVAQIGDVVFVDSRDANLWDYTDGETVGYTGLGRVLGAQASLDNETQTYLVAVDGIAASGPMCPSLPILAVNGTSTAPDSIDVDEAYYPLLEWAQNGQSIFYVQAYQPGEDSGHGQYTVSTISKPGGGVARMTIAAYPSSPAVTLTTSYRVTWPIAPSCTETQAPYLHNTDLAQWT